MAENGRPHIELDNDLPGIRGLFAYRPETARPMLELTEVLLCGPSTLTRGERELIATSVSSGNGCRFCTRSHGAFAAALLPDGECRVRQVCDDPSGSPAVDTVSPRLASLLHLAELVRRSGGEVRTEDVDLARQSGADDREIHDTVLIAAAFCMFNRYVDGLAALTPEEPASYKKAAQSIATHGYLGLIPDRP